jgi:hypothetical protein
MVLVNKIFYDVYDIIDIIKSLNCIIVKYGGIQYGEMLPFATITHLQKFTAICLVMHSVTVALCINI